MAKKVFGMPMVFAAQVTPGPTPPPGLGSSQGTTDDDLPFDWDAWRFMFEEDDSDGNNTPGEWTDYIAWWKKHGWTEEEFIARNGASWSDPEP